MYRFSVFMALLALTLHGRADAGESFSYDQLELGAGFSAYQSGHGSDDKWFLGVGGRLEVSRELAPHLFAFGALQGDYNMWMRVYSDDEEAGLDGESIAKAGSQLGLATHWPLGPRLDLVAGLSWDYLYRERDHSDYENSILRVRGGGPGLRVGLRGLLGNLAEWQLTINSSRLNAHIDVAAHTEDSSVSIGQHQRIFTKATAGVRFHVNDRFDVGPDLSRIHLAGDTEYRVGVGLRFQLGNREGSPD